MPDLPSQPTSFIGRQREVAAVCDRLLDPQVRPLTLTGPGGIGKTRLALKVAAELADVFADGVAFVNLAPLADPQLVPATVAHTRGLSESGG